jgi:threonyl-tRNA synthetase
MKHSQAYWLGDSKRESLQRVYGTSFPKKEELAHYLKLKEEALKRDHRLIGQN